jgi:hypothetical protein
MQRLPQRVDDVDRASTTSDQPPTSRAGRRPRACGELDGQHSHRWTGAAPREPRRAAPWGHTTAAPGSARLGSARRGRGPRLPPPHVAPRASHRSPPWFHSQQYTFVYSAGTQLRAPTQSVRPDLVLAPPLAPIRQPSLSAAPSAGGRPLSRSMADPAGSDRAWLGLPGPSDGPPMPGV